MLKQFAVALAVTTASALMTSAVGAASFTGTYAVNAFNETSNNGLDISTQNIAPNPFTLNLTAGGSQTINLFKIWTDEGSLNGDDLVARAISVAFSFSEPQPVFGGPVTGSTRGATILLASGGYLDWNDPIELTFGANNDGLLRIDLSEEVFNVGPFLSFKPGERHGAIVEAKFTLVRDATVDVPEPASLALLGLGLFGLGMARRRFG